MSGYIEALPIAQLRESKFNPRKTFDPEQLAELAASIREKGILEPLLVRQNGEGYELIFGHRRLRAATQAGLDAVPVIVRSMEDKEVLETQLVENMARADLHPLEEAEGYQQLMRKHKYDAARIAERLGRSVKYVYDRVRLLGLAKEARELFLEGRIAAGHAIILARLKPEDQKRCIGDRDTEGDEYRGLGGLFQHERVLHDPNAEDDVFDGARKAVSVRELQAWVDTHVRFHADADADPMLFPATVEELARAKEVAEKIVPITHEYQLAPDVRGEGRTYGSRSWKRADGNHKSKPCGLSVTGVVVVGPERGDAFKVCIAKEKCDVHWGEERREKAKRANAGAATAAPDRYEKERQKHEQERLREEALRARWTKATPAILEAVAAAVNKAPTKASGCLAGLILHDVRGHHYSAARVNELVPLGTTADDLVRHAAFTVLQCAACTWGAVRDFPRLAKALNVDVKKILDEFAPVEKPKPEKPAKRAKAKASKKRTAKKRAKR